MYSLLLMTAMAGGGDAPAFNGRLLGGCYGCHGAVVVSSSCYGSSCNGCWGSSCHGSWGSSCHGCTGSSCHGGFLGLRPLFHRHSCMGSCHGCTGSSCNGCWGAASSSPTISMGCWGGSCHGTWGAACYGASCHGSSCHGCIGSVTGVTYYDGAVIVMPSTGTAKMEVEEKQAANLTIEMPAGSKLFVDGTLVPGDATSRKFHTPQLVKGKKYYYEMKAEMTVAGKPVVEQRTVVVTAGDTITEKFGVQPTSTDSKTVLASN